MITPCAHVYCRNCITQHIESVPPPAACPLCRGVIKISLLLEAARDEENEEASDEFEDIIVETSSTKVMAVMQELVSHNKLSISRATTMSVKYKFKVKSNLKLDEIKVYLAAQT